MVNCGQVLKPNLLIPNFPVLSLFIRPSFVNVAKHFLVVKWVKLVDFLVLS